MDIIFKNNEKIIIIDKQKIKINDLLLNINIEKETTKFLKYIEEQNIDGLYVTDLYYYEDKPLYFFYRAGLFLKLKSILEIVIYLDKINDSFKEEFKYASLYTNNVLVSEIAKEIFKLKVIYNNDNLSTKENKLPYIKLFKRQMKAIITLVKIKFRNKNKPNILILSHASSIYKENSIDKEDYYDYEYGKIFDYIGNDFYTINLQYLNNIKMIDKSLKFTKNFIPFEFFVIFKKINWKKYFKKEYFKNNINILKNINFTYKKYDIYNILMNNIFNNIESIYKSYIEEYICAKVFLKMLNINNFITVDEADRARCFIIAGNELGINTYGIQHGIINETSIAYLINTTDSKSLVPKKTFLWGEKYKRFLIENSNAYNNNNLEVVGQLRTDYLVNKFADRNNKNNKMNILYATQYLEDLTKESTPILIDALKKLNSEFELIIKMHPSDPFYDYYKNMVSKSKLENVKITKDDDLYDCINWSDIIISVHSTVVLEGALMNKPSICIILPKYNDEGSFVKEGLSQGVTNADELAYILSKRNFNKEKEKLNNYIEKNFYKLDGNVYKRVLQSIKNANNLS